MLSEGTARNLRANVTLAVLLASVAGFVNGAGFLFWGRNTSHMTGHAGLLGEALGLGQGDVAWATARLLIAFVFGAATTAALLEISRGWSRGRHAPTILTEVLLLCGVALGAELHPGVNQTLLVEALAFAMGMQNALVTRVSGAVVRTTHVTGVLTDLGLEIVHWLGFWRSQLRANGLLGVPRGLRGNLTDPSFGRAWLHLAIAVSFVGGAALGAFLVVDQGPWILGLPSLLLLALLIDDLRPRPPATPQTGPEVRPD